MIKQWYNADLLLNGKVVGQAKVLAVGENKEGVLSDARDKFSLRAGMESDSRHLPVGCVKVGKMAECNSPFLSE